MRFLSTIQDIPHLLGLVPHGDVAQILLWACGEVKLEGESKNVVNTPQEVEAAFHLRLDL